MGEAPRKIRGFHGGQERPCLPAPAAARQGESGPAEKAGRGPPSLRATSPGGIDALPEVPGPRGLPVVPRRLRVDTAGSGIRVPGPPGLRREPLLLVPFDPGRALVVHEQPRRLRPRAGGGHHHHASLSDGCRLHLGRDQHDALPLLPASGGAQPGLSRHLSLNARRGTSCERSPTACVPVLGVDTLTTRLCQLDADCTSGGISTALTHCCQESTHSFKACLAACP